MRQIHPTTQPERRREPDPPLRVVHEGEPLPPGWCSGCHGAHAFATTSLTVRDARGEVLRVIAMRGATA